MDDSCVVELALAPEQTFASNQPAELALLSDDDGAMIQAKVSSQFKTFEILLTGIGIDVTEIEAAVLAGKYARFCWGCAFPRSGIQTLILRINIDANYEGGITYQRSYRLIHLDP